MLGAVIVTEYALEKYRQLIDDKEDRLFMRGAVADELFAVPTPVAGVQAGANLDAKVECTNLVDLLREEVLHPGRKARRDRADRMHGLRDVGDHVLRASRALDIGEEEDPSLGLEPSPKLLSDAGLPHPALAGQQDVVAGANQPIQNPQFRFAIEEVVTAHPPASGQSHKIPPLLTTDALYKNKYQLCCQQQLRSRRARSPALKQRRPPGSSPAASRWASRAS